MIVVDSVDCVKWMMNVIGATSKSTDTLANIISYNDLIILFITCLA
jgi:hypothetical protein